MKIFVRKDEVEKYTPDFIEPDRVCLYFETTEEFFKFKKFLGDVEECFSGKGYCEGHHYIDSDESLRDGKDVVMVVNMKAKEKKK